jgi:hypothetical protein
MRESTPESIEVLAMVRLSVNPLDVALTDHQYVTRAKQVAESLRDGLDRVLTSLASERVEQQAVARGEERTRYGTVDGASVDVVRVLVLDEPTSPTQRSQPDEPKADGGDVFEELFGEYVYRPEIVGKSEGWRSIE